MLQQSPAGDGNQDQVVQMLTKLDERMNNLETSVGDMRSLLANQQIEKEWYTTGEVAEMMEVKQYTVQERWCNQGRIECEKDPDTGHWRIPGHEVRRLRNGGRLLKAK